MNKKQFVQALLDSNSLPMEEIEKSEIALSELDLSALKQCLTVEDLTFFFIKKTRCQVEITSEKEIKISTLRNSQLNNETQGAVVLYLALVIAEKKLFFVVISKKNGLFFIDREPYFESLQEYQYQYQVAKIFGINNLQAYVVDSYMSEQELMDTESELLYCEGEQHSFLVYPLSN